MMLRALLVLTCSTLIGAKDVPACLQFVSNSSFSSSVRQGLDIWEAALNIPVNKYTAGWQLQLTFVSTVDVFANKLAHVYTEDNLKFTIISPDDILPSGSNLHLVFSAQYNSSEGFLNFENITFNGKTVCKITGWQHSPMTITPLKYDYGEVINESILFYEAQRSGTLPANNRIRWRKNSCTDDKGNNGEDLSGGYYTSGRTVKFTFPNAAATTVLAWGLISNSAGYKAASQYKLALNTLNWSAAYLAKCHTQKDELYVLVGDTDREINEFGGFWGRPEDIKFRRPAYSINKANPGSEVAAETAAALAASAVALNEYDVPNKQALQETYLAHAVELYKFANTYKGDYHKSVPQVANFYKSWSGYQDELLWAALWLYRATGDPNYMNDVLDMYNEYKFKQRRSNQFSWDDKTLGIKVLLSQMTVDIEHEKDATRACDQLVFKEGKTPKGLLFFRELDIGTIRYASNVAFICFELGEHLRKSGALDSNPYVEFAIQQVNYVLGDTGFSYMIGFGDKYPLRPHHSASSCPVAPLPCGEAQRTSPAPNPQILVGALVGGPGEYDDYKDERTNYKQNDVGLDYNAGFQSLVAGLLALHNTNELHASAYKA